MKTKLQSKILLKQFMIFALLFAASNSFAQIGDRLTINGYASFEYEYRLSEEGAGDPNGSFDADGIDLVFNFDISSRLRFVTDLAWEHGAATEDGYGNVAVEYAFPEYTVYDWLKFRAGKMLTPMGIYNEIHTAKPAFLAVKEPYSTNKPTKLGAEYSYYPRWNAGIAVLGNYQMSSVMIDYTILIGNGIQNSSIGNNPYEDDDNKFKAVTARLRATPIQGLRIGVSIYSDEITEVDTLGEDLETRTSFFTYGATAEYSIGNIGFEIEYINNKVEPNNKEGFPDNLSAAKHHGFEAMLYYTIMDRFTPYARFELYDHDLDSDSDDKATVFSFGINTMLDDNFFLKLQYNNYQHDEFAAKYAGVNNSQFQCALVLGF